MGRFRETLDALEQLLGGEDPISADTRELMVAVVQVLGEEVMDRVREGIKDAILKLSQDREVDLDAVTASLVLEAAVAEVRGRLGL